MLVVEPSFKIESDVDGIKILKSIEKIGRTCYKSEDRITDQSAPIFVQSLINRGHEAMLEHEFITVRFVVDRGVSHEIVRHRIASFAQESTRYCDYSNDKFGKEITVIAPLFFESTSEEYFNWWQACKYAEDRYFNLLSMGATSQEARSVLPNSLKTEIVVTMNLREWRHFFYLRAAKPAHPQMKEVSIPLLRQFQKLLPIVFDNIVYDLEFEKRLYSYLVNTYKIRYN